IPPPREATRPNIGRCRQCLGYHVQPLSSLSCFAIRLGEERKKPRPSQLCPCSLVSSEPLTDLLNPLPSVSVVGQRPAPCNPPHSQPVWEQLLARECKRRLGPLVGCRHIPAELMERSNQVQGKHQAMGMRQAPAQGDRLMDFLQGLIWVAE